MKKVFAGVILLAVVLALFVCYLIFGDTAVLSAEPLSDELKMQIKNRIILRYDDYISWDAAENATPYYGTINGCIIVQIAGEYPSFSGRWGKQIDVAGYTFRTPDEIALYAYRDGEPCTLAEAYERGWLTKRQIGRIQKRHDEIYTQWIEEYRLYQSLFELDGKKYEEVIFSSESAEDAVVRCTYEFANNGVFTVTKCEVIYESELLYGIYVSWENERGTRYEENVISFKKTAADIQADSVCIYTGEKTQIEKILLRLYLEEYSFHHIRDYKMTSNKEEYIMTIDAYYYVGGDWGVPAKFEHLEQKITLDKTTGAVTFDCKPWEGWIS